MKYISAALLFIGATQAIDNRLVQLNSQKFEELPASELENMNVQISNKLDEPCVYLDETTDEMAYQIDMFSRTLDPRHW